MSTWHYVGFDLAAGSEYRRQSLAKSLQPVLSVSTNNNKKKKADIGYNVLMGVAVVALVAAAWSYLAPHFASSKLPPLPDPPVAGVRDAIRSQIETAYDAVRQAPTSARANGALGMVLHVNGKLDEAVICYERARALAPASFEWQHYAGLALQRLGRDAEAQQRFTDAVARNPGYVASSLMLADIELANGEAA